MEGWCPCPLRIGKQIVGPSYSQTSISPFQRLFTTQLQIWNNYKIPHSKPYHFLSFFLVFLFSPFLKLCEFCKILTCKKRVTCKLQLLHITWNFCYNTNARAYKVNEVGTQFTTKKKYFLATDTKHGSLVQPTSDRISVTSSNDGQIGRRPSFSECEGIARTSPTYLNPSLSLTTDISVVSIPLWLIKLLFNLFKLFNDGYERR